MKCFAWTSFLHHRGAAKPGAVKFRRTYMDHITLYHPGVMLATPLSSFYYHYCITLVDMRGAAKPGTVKSRRTWITLYHPVVMLASCLYNLYHLDASIFLVTPCIRLVSPYIILV